MIPMHIYKSNSAIKQQYKKDYEKGKIATMGNPEHKKHINGLRLPKYPRESSIKDDSKNKNSYYFDEDDDLFCRELESKWHELIEDAANDNNNNE